MISLPETLRPRGIPHRKFSPGLDLPSWFRDNLQAIDRKLHLVYHPYRVMWEDIINEYTGSEEESRFNIHKEFGQENWGFVLTNGDGSPIQENSWHIWRLCEPYGWAHVVKIEDKHEHYLKLLLNRLHLQATFSDRYGARAWNHRLDEEQEEERENQQKDKQELFDAVHDENSWLMKKAAENFERGHTAPTNPQKETIFSAPGVNNKTKTVRPLTDREGGLYVPEDM